MDQDLLKNNPQYLKYLDEIRQRVYSLVVFFVIFFVLGFVYAGNIIGFIINNLNISNVSIVTTSPFQFFNLSMNVGIAVAMVLVLPLLLFHIYYFLRDGLNLSEKRFFFKLLPISAILFCIGFIYGFIIMYYAFNYIAGVNASLGISNIWDIDKFISQIAVTAALLGVIFQFPLVLSFLVKTNMVTVGFLKQKRRIAFAVIFIIVSLLPPTDGLSLIVMSLPLIFIYEITIFTSNFV